MILLLLIAFFIPSSDEHFINSPRSHLSSNLKAKCDALPYRSTHVEYGCYFAVMDKIEYSEAPVECSEIFPGAQVATKVPSSIFDAMMVQKFDFHLDRKSSGKKHIICVYENDYKCDSDQSIISQRCIFRAAKKMNFKDAKNYCADHGMEMATPANELDNIIIREVLVKDPAWVDKSLLRENGFKWRQAADFTKYTTCDAPTEQKPQLYSGSKVTCTNETASVIDKTGYWSNAGAQSLMEVVCLKNAKNSFTKGDSACKSYHAMDDSSGKQRGNKPSMLSQGATGVKTCYTSVRSTERFNIIGRATVETQRGCEVQCDARSECAGFAFKDAGFSSSCVLLSSTATDQICDDQTTIFQKKTTGCVPRTNLTAEFGNDPCIDEIAPSAFRGFGVGPVCAPGMSKKYIIRVIDSDGRRVTLDNDWPNTIRQSGDMWTFSYYNGYNGDSFVKNIVAAACVTAGSEKCPCEPIKELEAPGIKKGPPEIDVLTPCKNSALHMMHAFIVDGAKNPAKWTLNWGEVQIFVTCKAGQWFLWRNADHQSMMGGIASASCV